MKTSHPKSLMIATVFGTVLILSSVFISCEKPQHEDKDRITEKDIIALKENNIIPLKEAVKAYKKYSKDRAKILKDTLKKKYGNDFNDSRSVWFDIKTIKTYLKYIEDTSPDSIEGLQFYFTVDLESQGNKNNHQAFFVAPTKKNGNKQSGFTLVDGKIKFINEALKEYQGAAEDQVQKGSFFSLMQDNDGLLLNRGGLNPPGNDN